MKHAFIMDPLEGVKAWKDTTYFLMLAAVQRGHQVCYLDQRAIWLEHHHAARPQVCARITWLAVHQDHKKPFKLQKQTCCDLSDMDVVWIRTDPPFDRRYFYTTLLLDNLPATTRVLNRPSGIRNWNEKLAALRYAEFTPPTLVSNDTARIKQFSQELASAHQSGKVTIKPVDGFGGKGIIFYDANQENSDTSDNLLDAVTHNGRHWVIVQQYLPAAQHGDKRILLLNGKPLGAILRMHATGSELNNLDAGGMAHAAKLNQQDLAICAAVKRGLLEQGIFFAGLDIIGGRLIEINVTSPTGLQELCKFNDAEYHHRIIAALE